MTFEVEKNTTGRRAAALCSARVVVQSPMRDTFLPTPSSEGHLLLRAAKKARNKQLLSVMGTMRGSHTPQIPVVTNFSRVSCDGKKN